MAVSKFGICLEYKEKCIAISEEINGRFGTFVVTELALASSGRGEVRLRGIPFKDCPRSKKTKR